jgi:hypothetical protein
MGNMSAKILREIVARTFNVVATTIILSGEIEATKSFQNQYFDGSLGSNGNSIRLFGYNHRDGFVDLSQHVGLKSGSNYAHSSSTDVDGTRLCDIQNVDNYIFIVVIEEGYSCWEGSEQRRWNNCSIYKLPNFLENWEKEERTNIARWEQWIKE